MKRRLLHGWESKSLTILSSAKPGPPNRPSLQMISQHPYSPSFTVFQNHPANVSTRNGYAKYGNGFDSGVSRAPQRFAEP